MWGDRTQPPAATQIRTWWRWWPDANVGLSTGPSGLLVLDVDPRHGGNETLRELVARHGPLPPTPTVLTGGGGVHYWFRRPVGIARIGNVQAAAHLPGLDLRADGGLVVAPPSLHISGRQYVWEASAHIVDVPPADPPPWLLTVFGSLPSKASAPAPTPPAEWVRLVREGVPEGLRNTTAARLAGHLLRRDVFFDVVEELVVLWATHRCHPPLDADEARRVVRSVAGTEWRRRHGGARHAG